LPRNGVGNETASGSAGLRTWGNSTVGFLSASSLAGSGAGGSSGPTTGDFAYAFDPQELPSPESVGDAREHRGAEGMLQPPSALCRFSTLSCEDKPAEFDAG
jgi:hypothetical protein